MFEVYPQPLSLGRRDALSKIFSNAGALGNHRRGNPSSPWTFVWTFWTSFDVCKKRRPAGEPLSIGVSKDLDVLDIFYSSPHNRKKEK
jgi:hypothetical protein